MNAVAPLLYLLLVGGAQTAPLAGDQVDQDLHAEPPGEPIDALPVDTVPNIRAAAEPTNGVDAPARKAAPETETAAETEVEPEPETAPPIDEPTVAKLRLLTLPFESASLKQEARSVLGGRLATSLAADPTLEVITHEDLSRIVELEAERAVLGCDSSNCLAEVAGALGADLVFYGRVAKIDGQFILQLNTFRATQAKAGPRREVRATSVSELAERIPVAARSIVAELRGEDATMAFAEAKPSGEDTHGLTLPWLLTGGGVAVVGAGAAVAIAGLALGLSGAALFFNPPSPPTKQLGQNLTRAALPAVALGGALVVTGAVVVGASVPFWE